MKIPDSEKDWVFPMFMLHLVLTNAIFNSGKEETLSFLLNSAVTLLTG